MVVVPDAEPAVVQNEQLHTKLRRLPRKAEELFAVKVEIDRLPAVDEDGPADIAVFPAADVSAQEAVILMRERLKPLIAVGENVESIIKCRRNRYGFSCIIFLSEGRRKEVKTLNGYSYLTLEQRREIERMYAEGERVVDIAARLKRSAAAIYEELKRGYTGEFDGYARPKYSADLAQATVQENFRRRGNRRGANC